jgi:hypothetical protein
MSYYDYDEDHEAVRCTDYRCGYPDIHEDINGERYHLEDDHGPYPYQED